MDPHDLPAERETSFLHVRDAAGWIRKI